MKSIKLLLAALVFTATFAACTREDMTPTQEIQNDEFVGAQLAGTDISLNFGVGTDTKVTADGDWEDNDRMGLAWVVNGDYTTAQGENKPANNPNPFANHLFYRNGDDFTTKGNVYVGWHFAYFPYKHMPALNKTIEIAINPAQEYADFNLDYWNTALNISALQFVTADNVDEENDYQLADSENKELHFRTLKAPKTIKVSVKPSATFTGSDALKGLSINSIYLEAKEKAFYGGNVVLDPTALAKPVFEDGVYNEAKTFEALYESFEDVLQGKYVGSVFTAPSYTSSITTVIANDEINLSREQILRIHTLPKKLASMDKTKIKFIINVDNGFFTVQYIADEEDPRYNENNNEAIEDLVKAYTDANGSLTAYNNRGKAISLELTKAMFTVDFSNITSEKVWNMAVDMVDALGQEEADFTIALGEDGKEWKFTDKDGDGNLVNLPEEAVVTVKDGGKMILDVDGEWPAKGILVETNVEVKKTLNVADGVKFEAKKIINNGEINAGVKTSINPLDNKKRVNVVYGSYVTYDPAGTEGIVAYDLLANDTPARINTLLNGGDNGKYAEVNTLVINDGVVLDMMMTSTSVSGNDPYYNEVVSSNSLADLSDVDIEMNGGSIIGDVSLMDFVNNVKVLSNSNSIKDLNIKGNLTVKKNASVVLNATERSYGKKALTFNGNIINEGTLTSEVDVNISSIDNSKGITVVIDPYTITYKGVYQQGGLANGRILEAATPTPGTTVEVTNLADFNTNLAKSNVKVIVLKGLGTDANWKWTGVYDLKGKTIKVEDGSRLTFNGAIKDFTLKNGVVNAVVYANATKVTTFDGITFNASVLHPASEGVFEAAPTAKVVIKNSTFDNTVGRAIVTPYGTFAGDLAIDNTLFKSNVGQYNPYINPLLTGKVKFTNNIFELALVCEFTGKETQFTIEGNTFESMLCVTPSTAIPGIKSTDGLPAVTANFCKKVVSNNNFAREDKVAVYYTDKVVYYSEF